MAARLPIICPAGQINRHGSRTGTRGSRVESKPESGKLAKRRQETARREPLTTTN